MNNILIGKLGETYAENFLHAGNYRILQKNFRSRFGEIDLVVFDLNQNPAQLVFVEVKTRTSDLFGTPQESVSSRKFSRIFKTAIHFFNTSTKKNSGHWRIDAIAVKLDYNLNLQTIDHIKNIFDGHG